MKKILRKRTLTALFTFIFIYLFFAPAKLQSVLFMQEQDSATHSIMLIDTSSHEEKIHPGEGPVDTSMTSTDQDTAFARAMRLRIPEHSRFNNSLRLFANAWFFKQELLEENPWLIAEKNLQIPPEMLQPDGAEQVMHDLSIDNALYVPFMPGRNKYGVQIPLNAIGQLLGLSEDLSPAIKYTVDFTSQVEIVIYDVSARVIATVFKGIEQPGSYTKTWNQRDEYGRPVSRGDYIAEVRIGDKKFVMKRIYVGHSK